MGQFASQGLESGELLILCGHAEFLNCEKLFTKDQLVRLGPDVTARSQSNEATTKKKLLSLANVIRHKPL